jgi:hypothetical protein
VKTPISKVYIEDLQQKHIKYLFDFSNVQFQIIFLAEIREILLFKCFNPEAALPSYKVILKVININNIILECDFIWELKYFTEP